MRRKPSGLGQSSLPGYGVSGGLSSTGGALSGKSLKTIPGDGIMTLVSDIDGRLFFVGTFLAVAKVRTMSARTACLNE